MKDQPGSTSHEDEPQLNILPSSESPSVQPPGGGRRIRSVGHGRYSQHWKHFLLLLFFTTSMKIIGSRILPLEQFVRTRQTSEPTRECIHSLKHLKLSIVVMLFLVLCLLYKVYWSRRFFHEPTADRQTHTTNTYGRPSLRHVSVWLLNSKQFLLDNRIENERNKEVYVSASKCFKTSDILVRSYLLPVSSVTLKRIIFELGSFCTVSKVISSE